jgi:SAM-dependent methyltransferase
MKILNIGCTDEYLCNDPKVTFAGKRFELYTLDVDPASRPNYVQDIRQPFELPDKFDVVYISHVLEHIEREKLKVVVENCRNALRDKGELWVYVPCLEWACSEVLKGNESIVIQGALYGGQKDEWDTHKAAFSLNALASLLSSFGFAIRKGGKSKYISIVNGKEYTCWQNVVIGVKNGSPIAIGN